MKPIFLTHLSNPVLHDRKLANGMWADTRGRMKCEAFSVGGQRMSPRQLSPRASHQLFWDTTEQRENNSRDVFTQLKVFGKCTAWSCDNFWIWTATGFFGRSSQLPAAPLSHVGTSWKKLLITLLLNQCHTRCCSAPWIQRNVAEQKNVVATKQAVTRLVSFHEGHASGTSARLLCFEKHVLEACGAKWTWVQAHTVMHDRTLY